MWRRLRIWMLANRLNAPGPRATEAAHELATLGEDAVKPLVRRLRRWTFFRAWDHIAWALGELGSARGVEPLLDFLARRGKLAWRKDVSNAALLEDMDAAAAAAAVALGKLKDARSTESLLRLLTDGCAPVRAAAARGLGGAGEAQAVPPLVRVLKDADPEVRASAAFSLGLLGDRAAFDPLVARLSDAAVPVRVAATAALGALGDARAVALLWPLLGDAEAQVRVAAAKALQQLGQPQWLQRVTGCSDDFARIARYPEAGSFEALLHGLKQQQWRAAEALGDLGDARAVPELVPALTTLELCRAACEALGKLKAQSAVAAVAGLLSQADSSIRSEAIKTLQQIGDAAAVPALIEQLGADLSEAAAKALVALDSNRWSPLLAAGPSGIYQQIVNWGEPQLIPALIQMLEAPTRAVREQAAYALLRWAKSQPWLLGRNDLAQLIRQPHQDEPAFMEWLGSDCHSDRPHQDKGIGLSLPPEALAAPAPVIAFVCPNLGCGQAIRVAANLGGRKGRCNKCGQVLLIPASDD